MNSPIPPTTHSQPYPYTYAQHSPLNNLNYNYPAMSLPYSQSLYPSYGPSYGASNPGLPPPPQSFGTLPQSGFVSPNQPNQGGFTQANFTSSSPMQAQNLSTSNAVPSGTKTQK